MPHRPGPPTHTLLSKAILRTGEMLERRLPPHLPDAETPPDKQRRRRWPFMRYGATQGDCKDIAAMVVYIEAKTGIPTPTD